MNLNDLHTFTRVVELGTLSAAAREAGVGKSTVSRAIARPEEALGTELIRRSARSFAVTEQGQLLHARARGPLRELDTLTEALTDAADEPTGTLVFTAPLDVGRSEAVCALVAEYSRRYPQVTVEVRLDNRRSDLVEEGIDVALRAHSGPIPAEANLLARRLRGPVIGLFASPDYLAWAPPPSHPRDLIHHAVLVHQAFVRSGFPLQKGEEVYRIEGLAPAVVTNDFGMLHALAREGIGITLVSPDDAARDLDSGALVRVLPEWATPAATVTLLWPQSRHLSPRVRAFVELAVQRLG